MNGDLDGPPAGDGLRDALESVDGVSVLDADGEPLGSVTVVPKGVGEASGPTVVPGSGVAVAGTEVGRGVGLGVAVGGGGGGVGAGVGVGGAVTTIGITETGSGFTPLTVVPLNVAVQLPMGSDLLPAQIWFAAGPPVRASENDMPATVTETVDDVSVPG